MESEGVNTLINSTVIITLFGGACVFLLMYIIKLLKTDTKNVEKAKKNGKNAHADKKKDAAKNKKKGVEDKKWVGKHEKWSFSHPWLVTTMKGHTSQVLDIDISSNGKYLASCSEDRTVMLWDIKDVTNKDRKSLRVNIDFDYSTFVKWSPDTKAFISQKFNSNNVDVYKVEKRKDGFFAAATKVLSFPKVHEEDVIGLEIAGSGKFIMTCSNKTNMIIWDLRGQILGQVDTYLMSTSCAKISPCDKYVVASGFTSDVKIWEVVFTKGGDFQEVKRVFELTGHSSGVTDVAFDVDTSHIATVSKDGTWKLFDTKIDYKRGEDPHLKITGKYDQTSKDAKIALSPNAEVLVIASSNCLAFYSTLNGQLDTTIENVFNGNITKIIFDSLGKYLYVSGDKYIHVFHNITGYRCNIITAKEKLKQNQTSATKERLEQIVRDNEKFLKGLNFSSEM